MTLFPLILEKLKKFHMTVPSLILLFFASYRTLTSGDSIQLVGICAAVVPFICQFKSFHRSESAPAVTDVIASYITNLILMAVYLGWVLLLTWIGRSFVPSYTVNPYFTELLIIAVCADVVFISAVIPVCRDLKPMQRMIPALVLTNGLLVFMMIAAAFVKSGVPANLTLIACGFCALVISITLGLIFAGNREEK